MELCQKNEDVKTKECMKCKIAKPLTEFYNQKQNKKDGLAYQCIECDKRYKAENKEKTAELRTKTQKEYRNKNREGLCAKERLWYRKNKEHALETKKLYRRKKRANDPLFRARNSISKRIRDVLGGSRSKKSMEILGCDMVFFKSYMESLFRPGMSWDNYGVHGWHIDHKIPLASANTVEEIEKLCHYSNLQPLWAIDNIKKSDAIP